MRLRGLLTALGLNAVPALGWFLADWSAGTTLLVYWLETLIGILLVAARIVIHRRARPSKGHWDYRAAQGQQTSYSSKRTTYLSAFLVPAVAFSLVHGVFLGVLGFMMVSKHLTQEARVDVDALCAGMLGVAVFQLADFAFDLFRLPSQPFARVERLGNLSISRVLVIHLTILGGMAAVMFTGANRNFFGVFIFLKTMLNLSLVIPQYQPKTPPRWLSSLMDRVPGKKLEDANFAEFWKRTDNEEAGRIVRNEEPL